MPAAVIGPTVALIGLSFSGAAINDVFSYGDKISFGLSSYFKMTTSTWGSLICAPVTLATVVFCSVYGKKMKNYDNVVIFDHPLIRHKIAILRDKNTSTKEFRELVEKITTLMTYECFKDVPTVEKEVVSPLEVCTQRVVKDNSVAIVPILRAGLGMVNGIHALFPSARVGHIGMYCDEETLQPQSYYCKLPEDINLDDKFVLVVGPMLATGGSACDAIDLLKSVAVRTLNLWQ